MNPARRRERLLVGFAAGGLAAILVGLASLSEPFAGLEERSADFLFRAEHALGTQAADPAIVVVDRKIRRLG